MKDNISRCIIIVLDSLGIGAMTDASVFGDEGANTLGHIIGSSGSEYKLPNLSALGLLKAADIKVIDNSRLTGSYAKLSPASPAKDTTAGHWELAGLILKKPFPTYPEGFPKTLIAEFEKLTGTKTLGNCTASGTEIIERLGAEHLKTRYPIVYTSADSVFQIAAHEEAYGLEKLYETCRIARKMLTGVHSVGRVIARPFIGQPGSFIRTANRRDFSLSPSGKTILDLVKDRNGEVIGIGKIEDIFNAQGLTRSFHTSNNVEGMEITLEVIRSAQERTPSIVFTNLVDFDMAWGHRRDVKAYAKGLKDFDDFLPRITAALKENDVLFITADHGCDPTFKKHTDHTREYVPLLIYGKNIVSGLNLGTRKTFADLAKTIADFFNIKGIENGESLRELLKKAV